MWQHLSAWFLALLAPLAAGGQLMDELELEGRSVRIDQESRAVVQEREDVSRAVKSPAELSSAWTLEGQMLDISLPSGLDRVGFEAELRSNFYATYLFYRKLPEVGRQQVYRQYLKAADLALVRSAILQQIE